MAARPKKPDAAVHAVREVRVGIPSERLSRLQQFYLGLIGLPAWPDHRQIPGGWGAGTARHSVLFCFAHDAAVDPQRPRLSLTVSSLPGLEARLSSHEVPYTRQRGLFHSDDRLLVSDPAGHLVEIRQQRTL
ncbi:MAG: hypothetical protein CHACPFDD_01350 [Phycisphaerae bacterium]|nr:hypothetical protein [Phycisphaerae bacterium]